MNNGSVAVLHVRLNKMEKEMNTRFDKLEEDICEIKDGL
jgi:hypothetical protein